MSNTNTAPKENKLGTLPIPRLLGTMALPLVVSNLVQALYNIVDSIFVAKINENATKAVTLAFPVQMLIIAVAVGTGVGMSSLMSRKLGEKNFKDASIVANQGFLLSVLSSLLFVIFGLLFSGMFFRANTNNAEILEMGIPYLSICCVFSIGVFIQINCERIMQGTGHALMSMVVQLIGAVVNIILDPILIFGYFGMPAMGVAGAAVATICGQITAAIIAVILVISKVKDIKISLLSMKPNPPMILTIYKVGFPSIIMQALNSFILMIINGLLMPVSELSVWILGVYFKIQSFVFMPIFGLNNGVIPIVAYNYGARRKARITQTLKLSLFVALSVMALGTAIFWLFPGQLLSMFKPEETTKAAAVDAFRIISASFVFSGVSIVCSGVFQALGKGFSSLIISAIRQALVLLPALIALLYLAGPEYVWYAYAIAEIVACALSIIIMSRTYKKMISTITTEN